MSARARFIVHFVLRRMRRRERIFRDRNNLLDIYNDGELYDRFRFRRENILYISDLLKSEIDHPMPRKGSLPAYVQVMVALRFFASNCFQIVAGDLFGLDKATVSRVIGRVSKALAAHVNSFVYFPCLEDVENIKKKFYEIAGFPNVVGCIDCTHVNIIAPSLHEPQYVNRYGDHSINVQLVCDADLLIRNCVVNWPGSVNDSRILKESAFFRAYQSGEHTGILLGDSGYSLQQWLMTPYINPDSPARQRYNDSHKSTRQVIERANGVLKRRWHCLKSTLRYNPEKACNIIISCIILHNIATTLGLPEPPLDEDSINDAPYDDDDNDDDDVYSQGTAQGAKIIRDAIVCRYFQK